MDALKQKYGNESPEDRKKRKKSLVVPNIGTLAICIAMLAVGIQYNDEEECKGKVTYFTYYTQYYLIKKRQYLQGVSG